MDLINLDDIKGRGAINILETYEGKNPYLKKLKLELTKKGKLALTTNQTKYIMEFHDKEPIYINKVIGITSFLGEELTKKEKLKFTPERILIEYMLAESDKSYHVYGKLKRNQKKSGMYFLPKTQVLDDPYYEEVDIDVDFKKYSDIDQFVLKDGTIGRTPYEHQKKGVKFLLTHDGCLLADDMGLGKTYQAIIAALESGVERILIVCPSAVKINWEREINYFKCYDTSIIEGKKWNQAKFTIINYDILKNFHTIPGVTDKSLKEDDICFDSQILLQSNFDLCIIDEAHKLKDPKSIRGAIMKDLCVKHGIEKVWLLSGTPVANRPMDYYNLLKLIKAPIADNYKFYIQRYCGGRQITTKHKNARGNPKKVWITKDATNLEELAIKTKHLYLRRLKTEIGDMPEKTIVPTHHKFNKRQWRDYENLWEEYLDERSRNKKRGTPDRAIVELGLLRKFVAMEAISETIDMAENIIEEGHKVIIFCNFTDELMELQKHFKNRCVIHYGEMSDKEKQKSIDKFQENNSAQVFIGNIISAGVGITLTEATHVIFNSFDWVPGNNEQAEDRAYRIGQTNNVTVYYQLFEETISVAMWNTLQRKQEVIDIIMGEKEIDEVAAMEIMLQEIIDEYEES
jgi:SWI/SNF-related matrix-associated actin-dependent regulator of chromatin subfamily A-like protein 1